MKLKQRFELLRHDKPLAMILLLHILLCGCHIYHSLISPTHYNIYLRAGGCLLIAVMIFFGGRKGMSYGMLVYACALTYINTFYNYGSIFFMLVSIGANPKLKKPAIILYSVNAIISFSLQHLLVLSGAIHGIYILLFFVLISYVFSVHTPDKLNLTVDEENILKEMLKGKKQKEIELFSQPTITMKLKHARERNMCDSTAELVTKYKKEFKSSDK